MGCSLIGPALWRGREGGEARKRGDRHKREEMKRRRNDWTFVCMAARLYEECQKRYAPTVSALITSHSSLPYSFMSCN